MGCLTPSAAMPTDGLTIQPQTVSPNQLLFPYLVRYLIKTVTVTKTYAHHSGLWLCSYCSYDMLGGLWLQPHFALPVLCTEEAHKGANGVRIRNLQELGRSTYMFLPFDFLVGHLHCT